MATGLRLRDFPPSSWKSFSALDARRCGRLELSVAGEANAGRACRSREPNGDKAGYFLCSTVFALHSYNLLYTQQQKGIVSHNSRSTVKNPISVISSKDPSTPSSIKSYTQGRDHSTVCTSALLLLSSPASTPPPPQQGQTTTYLDIYRCSALFPLSPFFGLNHLSPIQRHPLEQRPLCIPGRNGKGKPCRQPHAQS